jgi:phosphatidylglycerophosphatase A
MMGLSSVAYIAVTVVLFIAGIWICNVTARDFRVHDHSGIVWDEIVGYLITMAFIPFDWLWVALGFLFFRIFDILKPWPIRWLDRRIPGGMGIMLDDVLAGVYAWVCLKLASQWEALHSIRSAIDVG